LAVTGLVGFNICLISAVRLGDPGSVGVIVGGVPVVLALAGPALRRESPRFAVVGAAAVVFIGATVVQWTGGGLSAAALGLALGAMLCEAAFSLVALPLLHRLGPLGISTYACLAAATILAIGAAVTHGVQALPTPTATQAVAIVELAVVVTAVAFMLWYSSLARIGVERAGLFAGLIPVSALVTSALVGQSSLTGPRLFGAVVVGVGVAVGVRASARPRQLTAAAA